MRALLYAALGLVVLLVAGVLLAVWAGRQGEDQPPGAIATTPRAAQGVAARSEAQRAAAPPGSKHVLFGDLHVHTTYSLDAFFTAMPILAGEGAHPPADACDFARHCAALDFFSITDHASELTPDHWAREKEAVRQCNAVAGAGSDPDLVAFHGFEWTQIGSIPERHYGHKNVIFRGLGEEEVPARPITSFGGVENINPWHDAAGAMRAAGVVDPANWKAYADFGWKVDQMLAMPMCDTGANTRDLPLDCMEGAPTPDVLFRKLDEWGFDSLVIPHGNAWGSYTPPNSSWDKQLEPGMHDPKRQRLVEIMSGHGNSEQYGAFREFLVDDQGHKTCPEPSEDYLPCCWQAGEIMRQRCDGLSPQECERRVARAKRLTMEAGVAVDKVFPGSGAEDWLDCGQPRRGFKAAYGLRPRGTVQYAMSLSRPEAEGVPRRFRFGFISSSDNHTGRAATGFKQDGAKRGRTDMTGPRNEFYRSLLDRRGSPDDPQQPVEVAVSLGSQLQIERIASFFYPGGLVAVHAASRSRDAIWEALERREVYGTSGPRILLWFDLVNGAAPLPMGSESELGEPPRFRVRAVGSFVQKPGCPADAASALGAERIANLCLGECYHPEDRRRRIAAIEVVRVRPQLRADEEVTPLIEDPWRVFPCEASPDGCEVEFADPDFPASGRDAVYYARALQEPTPALNGANLRTRFDEEGRPTVVRPCAVDDPSDDCLAPVQERAWSSPIFVDQLR